MKDTRRHKPVIGLVGGVGAGKSTAAAEFAALGCECIDADAIGHELLADREVLSLIEQRWGESVLTGDGRVDREALGSIVFESPVELDALNDIMYARIRQRIEQRIDHAQRDASVAAVVVDAAVMFEARWDELCSHVLFVDAAEDVRAKRAMVRGWTRQTWLTREKSQISLDKKRAECYRAVDNSSSVSHLRDQIHQVFDRIVREVTRP